MLKWMDLSLTQSSGTATLDEPSRSGRAVFESARAPTPASDRPQPLASVAYPRRWHLVGPMLAILDLIAVQLAWLVSYVVVTLAVGPAQLPGRLWLVSLIAAGGWGVLRHLGQGYPGFGLSALERLRRLVHSAAGLTLAFALAGWLVRHLPADALMLGLTIPLALGLLVAGDIVLRRWLMRWNRWGRPVLVLDGDKPAGRNLIAALQRLPELGLVPVAGVGERPRAVTTRASYATDGVPLLGPLADHPALAADIGLVLQPVALEHHRPRAQAGADRANDQKRDREAEPLPDGVRCWHVVDPTQLPDYCLRLHGLFGEMPTPVRAPLSRNKWLFKRTLDLAVSIPVLLLLSPVLLMAGLAIAMVSPGPVFYRQWRIGLGGRSIPVWKLRTMHVDAEQRLDDYLRQNPEAAREWAEHCKLQNDPRVIPFVGRLLRTTSLDEVPQLWNVIRGEMSLVGPRPLPAYHLEQFPPQFRTLRRSVRPGVTGLWQVTARANGDKDLHQVLDHFYLRRWSHWLDLYLLLNTIPAVLTRRGAY